MKIIHLFQKSITFCFLVFLGNIVVAQDSLKILSYNIQGMKPGTNAGFRLSHILDELKALDPDIIALQEINQILSGNGSDNQGQAIADALSNHFEIEYHYYQQFTHLSWDNQFREYIGIISKYPVEKEGFFQLVKGVFPRKIVWNYIETPFGKVNFFSTHLSFNSQAVRLEQVKQLSGYIKDVEAENPSVSSFICGDFNDISSAPSISFLKDETSPIYFDLQEDINPCENGFTVPSNKPNARIDYIFQINKALISPVSLETVMKGVFVGSLYRSDHLGVMASFVKKTTAVSEMEQNGKNNFFEMIYVLNPYTSNSPLKFELFHSNKVYISVINELGQEITILKNEKMSEGIHDVSFDSSIIKGKIFFLKIVVNGKYEILKLVKY